MLDQRADVRGGLVVGREIVESVDFEPPPIVMCQQRLHKYGHHVAAKIRRHIPDLETSARERTQRDRRERPDARLEMAAVRAMLGGDCGGGKPIGVAQRKQQIAPRARARCISASSSANVSNNALPRSNSTSKASGRNATARRSEAMPAARSPAWHLARPRTWCADMRAGWTSSARSARRAADCASPA